MIGAASASTGSAPATTWQEWLADGTTVTIRRMRRTDAALEFELLDACSPQARRMRFLGAVKPTLELARRLVDEACDGGIGLIAISDYEGRPSAVGECSLRIDAIHGTAQCEVIVRDDWQQRGLGVALMRHLIELAKRQGIRKLVAVDSTQNLAMRELADHLGFERRICAEDPTMVVQSLAL